MSLENYIEKLRDLATNLEEDVSTLNEMADDLELIKDEIEGASDFFEIKDALSELENFHASPYDLCQPDYNTVTGDFDLEGWSEEYANRVSVDMKKPEVTNPPKPTKTKK